MRGPAASRYTGVGTGLRFRSRVSVGPKPTASPASSRRTSRTASRMIVTVPRGFPMLRVEMNPGAMVSRARPGASSSRLCASEASSSGCRTIGLDVAGKRRETPGRVGRQGQGHVRVAPARWVVVDADAVEAGRLAARDDVGQLGQRPANRHPQADAEAGHPG